MKAPREAPRELVALAARERVAPAVAAAAWTGWVAWALPFYPPGWPLGLTIATGALGLAFPRVALAFAFAVTFFPLCEHLARARDPLRGARCRSGSP